MYLLTPEDVKTIKKVDIRETQIRSNALAVEEARLTKQINIARLNAKIEIESLKKEIEEYGRTNLQKQKQLADEVVLLERQREEALKPIHQLQEEAKNTLKIAQEGLLANKEAKLLLDDEKEALIEAKEELAEQLLDVGTRSARLEKSEQNNKIESDRLKAQWITINEEWVRIHEAEHKVSRMIIANEEKVSRETLANKIYAEELAKREAGFLERERGIQDRYATLARAIEEFENKKVK